MLEIKKPGGSYEKDRLEVVDYDIELIDAASSGGRLGGESVYAGLSKPEKKAKPHGLDFLRTFGSSVYHLLMFRVCIVHIILLDNNTPSIRFASL
jgi:hypothetical protein